MQFVAYFSYLPSQTVSSYFTITLEKCYSNVITVTPLTNLIPNEGFVYQVGGQSTTLSVPMSQQYPNDCGAFNFTVNYSTKTPGITFNSSVPAVTVYSNAPTTDGKYTVTITGTLYIPGTSTVSMS